MMRVLRTGRFSLLVVKGGMEKEPQDCVLRLTRLSVGEQGDFAAIGPKKHGMLTKAEETAQENHRRIFSLWLQLHDKREDGKYIKVHILH